MSKQIRFYEEALCSGMDTNLFYMSDEELLAVSVNLFDMRRMCLSCPVMKECLNYGFTYERYGMFGGVTQQERELMRAGKWDNKKMTKMVEDFNNLNVSLKDVVEASKVDPEFF
jgi:hypothetical protein